jgi:hypothetical protein
MGMQGTKRSFPCQRVLASVHSAGARKQWIDPTIVFVDGLGRVPCLTIKVGVMGV